MTTREQERAAAWEVFEGRAERNPYWVEPPCTVEERAANRAKWYPTALTLAEGHALLVEVTDAPGSPEVEAALGGRGMLYTPAELAEWEAGHHARAEAANPVAEAMRGACVAAVTVEAPVVGVAEARWAARMPKLAPGSGCVHLTGPMEFLD